MVSGNELIAIPRFDVASVFHQVAARFVTRAGLCYDAPSLR